MTAGDIARGGLLTAAAVVLLYLGSASLYLGVAASVLAGVCTAVPLLRRQRVRLSLLIFAASALLALGIVPRKSFAVLYIAFTGLYPIIKYGVECRVPRRMQTVVKLVYCNLCIVGAALAVYFGLTGGLTLPKPLALIGLVVLANLVFLAYDTGLSRLIATLRRTLPPL